MKTQYYKPWKCCPIHRFDPKDWSLWAWSQIYGWSLGIVIAGYGLQLDRFRTDTGKQRWLQSGAGFRGFHKGI